MFFLPVRIILQTHDKSVGEVTKEASSLSKMSGHVDFFQNNLVKETPSDIKEVLRAGSEHVPHRLVLTTV